MLEGRAHVVWFLSLFVALCSAARELPRICFRGTQSRAGPWSADLIIPHKEYLQERSNLKNIDTVENLWRKLQLGPDDDPLFEGSPTQNASAEMKVLSSMINAARYAISFPKNCVYDGETYECRFGLSCWMRGHSSLDRCGGGSVWTCCVPPRGNITDEGENVLLDPACGRTYMRNSRVIGGTPATFGEQPWVVGLIKHEFFAKRRKCGGALISDRFILTAAHCVDSIPAMRLRVRLGDHESGYSLQPYEYEDYLVKRSIIHERYNRTIAEQDIALVELTEPVQFRKHIAPICLPEEGSSFADELATVAGWGSVMSDHRIFPYKLHKVDVRVLDNRVCRSWLSTYNLHKRIKDNMLCAGSKQGGKDSCFGDSGSPLYLRKDGVAQVIGIVSWGYRCGLPNAPGIYTRVTDYIDWIRDKMNKELNVEPISNAVEDPEEDED